MLLRHMHEKLLKWGDKTAEVRPCQTLSSAQKLFAVTVIFSHVRLHNG